MTARVSVGIAGTGAYLPEREVPNEYFESIVDTSDEWITQRTGIKTRRFAAPDQATSDLSVEAAKQALEMAGIGPEDLDLIILGTLTPDHLLPATSARVQELLGAKNSGAFDVNGACSGFMSAFNAAESFIAAGRAKRVLAIGAETLTRFVDFKDRTSCILFGDGAGACVLAPHEDCGRGEVLRTTLGADGSGYEFIHMVAGGSRKPPTHETIEAGEHHIRVRGREVYRFAVSRMAQLISEMLEGHDREELGLVVPHQVNQRIIKAALERLELDPAKVLVNIDRYGNTSAATVPIALDEALREGRLEPGKLVVMCAFGAGLTWGASLLRW